MNYTKDNHQSISPPTGTLGAGIRYPVVYWAAALGAALFLFEIYILVKWIAGPDFIPVPYGPSEPPDWMKLGIRICEFVGIVAGILGFWIMSIRPWVRERQVTLWGLLYPALLLTSIYDNAGNYFGNWFGYNAYFLNFGNPLPGGLPGWQGFAQPGAMTAYPVIFVPTCYPFLFMFAAWPCVKLMQTLRKRSPRLSWTVLVPAALVLAFFLDMIIEGLVFMKLGWYTEAGMSFLNEGNFYQWPLRNGILTAVVFSATACLMFFRDDHGNTFVERGIERMGRHSPKGIALRFLAILAATQVIMFLGYHAPSAIHEKYFPSHWPESMTSKTYFNNHQCGFDTPRVCP